ncbi:hypothetical protein HHI36_024028, partial [Cryptolaemus montrouzieri]
CEFAIQKHLYEEQPLLRSKVIDILTSFISLNQYRKSIDKTLASHIRETKRFLSSHKDDSRVDLNAFSLPHGYVLVSLDVISVYTNTPTDHNLRVIQASYNELLEEYESDHLLHDLLHDS